MYGIRFILFVLKPYRLAAPTSPQSGKAPSGRLEENHDVPLLLDFSSSMLRLPLASPINQDSGLVSRLPIPNTVQPMHSICDAITCFSGLTYVTLV